MPHQRIRIPNIIPQQLQTELLEMTCSILVICYSIDTNGFGPTPSKGGGNKKNSR